MYAFSFQPTVNICELQKFVVTTQKNFDSGLNWLLSDNRKGTAGTNKNTCLFIIICFVVDMTKTYATLYKQVTA